ncbi:hypothetical protein [Vibrio fluvialis]|uniref:hypothetical protein n=1 Tax=Vibrio fluvialis TaxID=676 RepID=UPI0023A95A86|nr:hypothetical protein [Vibrio fluvialis]MDE5179929.1 hypothetical protein [Vibrio fluvialis]
MKNANQTNDVREKAKQRKRKSRASAAKRREALGIERVEIELSKKARDELEFLRHARGPLGDPYLVGEYISELIMNDAQRYQEQVAALGCCGKCKNPLPRGCDGLFDGDSDCLRFKNRKELML